ncbi:hypothetical protein [Flavivirga eckloniae]|uniref:Cyclodipeptide synthase n=1 Tax=Flavivirga eckloniae TaxID=1803846 RepID=A0A2K9PPW9_9FLAO|nr:hypothetical protein [Flavivirga eckloniae]AUP79086.1 hypothetical protein C1H87_10390 [Flavivirga eckloniae]
MNKSILLVSLNSKRLDKFIQNGLNKLIPLKNVETDIYIFDVFEVLNGILFNSSNILDEKIKLGKIMESVYGKLFDAVPNKGEIIKYSEHKKEIRKYMSIIYNEYLTNPSFERHLCSQIFQNLQPKLRRYNITDSKDSLIELMTPFLLTEFAFYLYVFDIGKYDFIYGLEDEMEFIKSIKNSKYENFNPYIKYNPEYRKIEF